jgi:hypothetical protein
MPSRRSLFCAQPTLLIDSGKATKQSLPFRFFQYNCGVFTFLISAMLSRSRVSSGSIVSDYGLDDRAIGVRFPAEAKDFSCSLCVQTGSGAHPASCTMGTGGPFPGGKSADGALPGIEPRSPGRPARSQTLQ